MSIQQGSRPSESCLLIPVPEAEPVVGRVRGGLDRAAAWGVPAHVTILYPFVAPEAITSGVIELAAAAVASVPAFECTFAQTGWVGENVLWLAPEPDRPFRALPTALHATSPRYPPFGGVYPDLVPHLTVGDRPPGGLVALEVAQADVEADLPVHTFVGAL